MISDEGIGWLIESGQLCLGVSCGRMTWVSFTDPSAIRFARRQDAENVVTILQSFGSLSIRHGLVAINEHEWVG